MDDDQRFEIELDGQALTAKKGQTIAEALMAQGQRVCGKTRKGAKRGVYCGIGLCYECRMIVNGIPNVRTCMTPATPGCKVTTQEDAEITFRK